MILFIYNNREVPLWAFITLLMTHCYCVLAILERKVYIDEELTRTYRLEDFLWSGSADTDEPDATTPAETTAITSHYTTITVFHTTTIMSTATIIYNTVISSSSLLPHVSKCENPMECAIKPTPTKSMPLFSSASPWPPLAEETQKANSLHQRYWIITELKGNNASDILSVPYQLEEQLARLYKTAFNRQQAVHLGLYSSWNVSNIHSYQQDIIRKRRESNESVTVQIHNVSSNGYLQILYSVRVAGQPILATTAVRDMTLVSDSEVVAELGYPIVTKAKPYLNSNKLPADGFIKEHTYFVIVGAATCIIVLATLLLMISYITLKKRKTRNNQEITTPQSYIVRSQDSLDKMETTAENQLVEQENKNDVNNEKYDNGGEKQSMIEQSTSNQRPSIFHLRPQILGISSPNSFLSMPSVKDFPSASLPQPLTDVLPSGSPPEEEKFTKVFRHNSAGKKDPGVISPVVWDPQYSRMKNHDNVDGADEECSSVESDKMNTEKHTNIIIQDASSDNNSPAEESPKKNSTSVYRSQSAPFRKSEDSPWSFGSHFHLKTSVCYITKEKDIARNIPKARDAWNSSTLRVNSSKGANSSSLHHPIIQPELILTDSHLPPDDPAMPVIAAIREELEKLPSRTSTPK